MECNAKYSLYSKHVVGLYMSNVIFQNGLMCNKATIYAETLIC